MRSYFRKENSSLRRKIYYSKLSPFRIIISYHLLNQNSVNNDKYFRLTRKFSQISMRWIFYRIVPRRISFRHARSNLVIDTWVKTVAKLVENITPDGFNAQRMVLFSVQTRYDYAFFRCNTLSLPSEQETRLEKKFRSIFARWMNFPFSIIFFFFFHFSSFHRHVKPKILFS